MSIHLRAESESPLIHLDDTAVMAGSVQILRGLDVSVGSGEILGIFGANGAGKTTFLRLVATLISPSAGSGTVLGASLTGQDRYDVRHRIGYVGHVPGLYPELTLAENLEFSAASRAIEAEAVSRSLAAVGLGGAADRRAAMCSHGMQRRAEFARVLMTEPELLLLDEPHSALDEDAIDLVDGLVERTVDRGGAAVLVSHDKERVLSLAHRTMEVREGTLV